MKKLLMFLIVLILCSFLKKESDVNVKANEFMDYCNAHQIKAQVVFQDSIYFVKLKNF